MGVGDFLRKMFSPPNALPPDGPRLSGASESALGSSLQSLPAGERGWITLAEAARLFSSEKPDYAFGEMDEAGKDRLAQFPRGIAARRSSCPSKGAFISCGIRRRSSTSLFVARERSRR